ncbi:mitochondrial carrier domain-containing protein [Lentinula guzmanii]|uniref:Mitochondrial carrier domain-containing protein n=2 Tax=Lentinula TaxID=5352 RepID=A0AA38MW39_9AGAR|nr:mitochondrial carrier domain-containing protein [Lentinula guzmanii]KAJ3982720.1 mitochondrial carrier domain-containing protein [Lentinula detonsa]
MSKSNVNPPLTPPAPTSQVPSSVATPKKKKPYPFWLGGVAATIAASITHPLDLTKVRLQASGDKRMLDSLQKTVRTAGVRGLFDGISGTWMRQMSYSMCRFWAYEESKKLLDATSPSAPAWKLGLAGSMAGGIAGLVGNPGEIVMVRLQGDFAKPPEKRFNYKHCFDALFRMVREEGPSSLARGVGPNVFRAVLMNASQLASYDFFKATLLATPYFDDNIYCHFTASFAAGTVATTVCSPADVLKSRIMNASGPGSSSTIATIRTALANEGALFVFKGWVPAWMRLQPTTILIFLTLEQLKRGVDWTRGKGWEAL